jgi:hypothetical protein
MDNNITPNDVDNFIKQEGWVLNPSTNYYNTNYNYKKLGEKDPKTFEELKELYKKSNKYKYLLKFKEAIASFKFETSNIKQILIDNFKLNYKPDEKFLMKSIENAKNVRLPEKRRVLPHRPTTRKSDPNSNPNPMFMSRSRRLLPQTPVRQNNQDIQFQKYISNNFIPEIMSNNTIGYRNKNYVVLPYKTVKELYKKQTSNKLHNPSSTKSERGASARAASERASRNAQINLNTKFSKELAAINSQTNSNHKIATLLHETHPSTNNQSIRLSSNELLYNLTAPFTTPNNNSEYNSEYNKALKLSQKFYNNEEAKHKLIHDKCEIIKEFVSKQNINIKNDNLIQLVSEIITLCIQHNILKQNDFEMIEPDEENPIKPTDIPDIIESKLRHIFENVIKIKTSGNRNDCLIHSILTSISGMYRTLDELEKKIIASYFRRYIFSNLDRIDKAVMESEELLTDTEAEIIANYYHLNIIILVNSSRDEHMINHFRFFGDNHSDYIILHNNGGSHYSTVFLNNKYTLEYRLGQELNEKYGEMARGNEILRCKFNNGNKIQSKDKRKQFLVISRKFDDISSYGGNKECVSITVNEINSAGLPITINSIDFDKYDIISSGGSRKNKKKSIKKTILKKSKKGKCKK